VSCFLCSSEMEPLFCARDYRRPSDPTEQQVVWCKKCAYGRVLGDFSPSEVARFYHIPYYTHDRSQRRSKEAAFFDRLRVHLAWRVDAGRDMDPNEIGERSNGRARTLCDIGCGSGDLLSKFSKAGYDVLGIEPDPQARALAERAGKVLPGTAEELPCELGGKQFDVVLLSHVLEHCIEPMCALANARQILATEGTLVIEVPNNAARGFSTFKAVWPWTDLPRHLHFFTERSLRSALYAVGLSVTKVCYLGYTRQFQSEWISTQHEIWKEIGAGPPPDFKRAAWLLLLRTAFARNEVKYDSIRVHARAAQAE